VGLVLFGAILYVAGIPALERVIRSDFRYLAVTLVAVAGVTAASAYRWGLLANAMAGRKVASWGQYYHYNILGRVTGLFIPKLAGDFGTRSLALSASQDSGLGLAFSSAVLDRVFDIMALVILLVPGLLFVGKAVSMTRAALLSLGLIILVGVVIALRWAAFWRWMVRMLARLAKWGGGLPLMRQFSTPRRIARLQELAEQPIESRLALQIYGITLGRTMMMVVRSYSVALALGIELSPLALYLVVPVAQLSLMLAITPMGLGLRELGWAGVLALIGVDGDDALTFALGHRAYLYVCVAILGLLSYLAVILARRRSGGATASTSETPADLGE
jgi:uncharacterized protein (TIRG00374 family)